MTESNTKEIPFPQIPGDLLKELNRRFPEACADLEWDHKQIWFVSGQRAVVRFLNHVFNEQNENALS